MSQHGDTADSSTSIGCSWLRLRSPYSADLLRKRKKTEASRAYRERLKQNPELFKAYREYENARIREYKANMSEEKKKEYIEKSKLRVQKCRARRQGGESCSPQSSNLPKETMEKLRNRWKTQKANQRAKLTEEERTAMNQRRREQYAKRRSEETTNVVEGNEEMKSQTWAF